MALEFKGSSEISTELDLLLEPQTLKEGSENGLCLQAAFPYHFAEDARNLVFLILKNGREGTDAGTE